MKILLSKSASLLAFLLRSNVPLTDQMNNAKLRCAAVNQGLRLEVKRNSSGLRSQPGTGYLSPYETEYLESVIMAIKHCVLFPFTGHGGLIALLQ